MLTDPMTKEKALAHWYAELFQTAKELVANWHTNVTEVNASVNKLGRITEQIERWEKYGGD